MFIDGNWMVFVFKEYYGNVDSDSWGYIEGLW